MQGLHFVAPNLVGGNLMSNPVVSDPVEKVRAIVDRSTAGAERMSHGNRQRLTAHERDCGVKVLRFLADPGCEEKLARVICKVDGCDPDLNWRRYGDDVRAIIRTLCAAAVGDGE